MIYKKKKGYLNFEQSKAFMELGFPQTKAVFYYNTWYVDADEACGDIVNRLKFNYEHKDIRKYDTVIDNIVHPLIKSPSYYDEWNWDENNYVITYWKYHEAMSAGIDQCIKMLKNYE